MLRIHSSTAVVLLKLTILCWAWTSTAVASEIRVANDCVDKVRLAVRYSARDEWRTEAWYLIEPGVTTYLLSNERERIRMDSKVLYFFAESTDAGKKKVWRGAASNKRDRTYTVDGRKLRFRSKSFRNRKNIRLRLTCPDRLPIRNGPAVPLCLDLLGRCCNDSRLRRPHKPFWIDDCAKNAALIERRYLKNRNDKETGM